MAESVIKSDYPTDYISDVTHNSSYINSNVRGGLQKSGHVVNFTAVYRTVGSSITIPANTTILTIPAAVRPKADVDFLVFASSGTLATFRLTTGGEISSPYALSFAASMTFRFNATWMV